MAEITLLRQDKKISDEQRAELRAALEVIYRYVDGLGEAGKKQWRRFWNAVLKLEIGELVTIRTHKQRVGVYHRRQMLLESRVFEAQERFDNFDPGFRDWLKVGAGHVDWYPGPKGAVMPVPKSIAYDAMEQTEFEAYHQAAVDFLRTEHAIKTLWPKLPPLQRHDAIEAVLGDFREFGL